MNSATGSEGMDNLFSCSECSFSSATKKGVNIHKRRMHDNGHREAKIEAERVRANIRSMVGGQLGAMGLGVAWTPSTTFGRRPIPFHNPQAHPGMTGGVAMLPDEYIPNGVNPCQPMPQIHHNGHQGMERQPVFASDTTMRRKPQLNSTYFPPDMMMPPPNMMNPASAQTQAHWASVFANLSRYHQSLADENQAHARSSSIQTNGFVAPCEPLDLVKAPAPSSGGFTPSLTNTEGRRYPSPGSVQNLETPRIPPSRAAANYYHSVEDVSARDANSSSEESSESSDSALEDDEMDTGRHCPSVEDFLPSSQVNGPKALRNMWPKDLYKLASLSLESGDRLKQKICELDENSLIMTRLEALASCLLIDSPKGSDQTYEMECCKCQARFSFLPALEMHIEGHILEERHSCDRARRLRRSVSPEAERAQSV